MNNPYVGPGPFGNNQHLFGRDAEIEELQWRLIADRIIVLYSPSGAGKTSLLMAKNGLISRLTERFHVLPVLRTVRKETTAPVTALLLQLEESGFAVKEQNDTLISYFSRLEIPQAHPAKRILLVLDQFEEIFTSGASADEHREFFNQLGDLLSKSPIWLIASMREEYFSWLDSFRDVIPTRLSNTFRLTQLTTEQAVEAVKGPTDDLGVQFPVQDGQDAATWLVRELSNVRVRTAAGVVENRQGSSVEPVLLQVICSDLWDRLSANGKNVTTIHVGDLANYNPETALQDYCDKALEMTASKPQRGSRLRDWIDRRLLTHSGLRAPAMIDPTDKDCPTVQELSLLEGVHLIRRQCRDDGEWYELAHDRLASPIRRSIESWRLKNLEIWQQLAHAWHLGGEQSSYFKTLPRRSTRHFPKLTTDDQFSETETRFLNAYRQYHSSKWRWHGAWAFAFAAIVIGLFLSMRQIETQAKLVATRNTNAVQAGVLSILGAKPGVDLGALATVVGTQLQEKAPESVGLNFRTLLSDYLNKSRQIESIDSLGIGKSRVVLVDQSRLILAEIGNDRYFVEVREAMSPNQTWRFDTEVLRQAHPKGIRTLAVLGDDQLATGDSDGVIQIWNLSTRKPIGKAIVKAGDLNTLRMQSPVRSMVSAGGILYAGFDKGAIAAWRLSQSKDTDAEPLWSARLPSRASALATFNAGTAVAVADISSNEQVTLFNYVNNKLERVSLSASPKEGNFKGAFYSIATSADGQFVAAGNRAGRIYVWNMQTRKLLLRIDAHDRSVVQLKYLQDGSLLSGGWDGRLKRWGFTPDAQALLRTRTVVEFPRQLVSIAPLTEGRAVFITTEKGDLVKVALDVDKHPFGKLLPNEGSFARIINDSDNLQVFTEGRHRLTASILDPKTGAFNQIRTNELPGVVSIASAQLAKALFVAQPHQVYIFRDQQTEGEVLVNLPLPASDNIMSINVNSSGTLLRVETASRNLLLALSPSGEVLCELKPPTSFPHTIRILAFRPNSSDFATVISDKLLFWTVNDSPSGCPVIQPASYTISKERGDILALTFDSSGRFLWFGNIVGQLYSAKLDDAKPVAEPYKGASTVEPVALAVSDNGTIAMGDSNGRLYVFQPGSSLPMEVGQDFHDSDINNLALSRDGQWLVSSSKSGTAIWDLRLQTWIKRACDLATDRDFTDEEIEQYFKPVAERLSPCTQPQ